LGETAKLLCLYMAGARTKIKSLFKLISEKMQCFFYPIKIGVSLNLYKSKN